MESQETAVAEDESQELDPRVQEELEKLNSCTDEINRLIINKHCEGPCELLRQETLVNLGNNG